MPFFLHQWTYKDEPFKVMLLKSEDRSEVVRTAVEAFGGTLHGFYYCFGQYDALAISEFPDAQTALACMMTSFAQGRIASLDSTQLFSAEEGLQSIMLARAASIGSAAPPDRG